MNGSINQYRSVTVQNPLGLHMRVAQQIVIVARKFKSTLVIRRSHISADATSIFEVLMLAAIQGTVLDLQASGDDADVAISEIARLIDSKCDDPIA